MINYKITGLEAIIKNLVFTVAPNIKKAYIDGLNDVADELLKDSLEICPKDTGELRKSGKVYKRATQNNSTVVVGYGQEYAMIVHEMPDTIKWTTPGTGNKYLEKPANQNRKKYKEIIKAKVKGVI
jgi:hypothetical protein